MKLLTSTLYFVLVTSFSNAQSFLKTYIDPDTSRTFIINNVEAIENDQLLLSGLDFRNGVIAKSSSTGDIEWAKRIVALDSNYGGYVSSCIDICKLQGGDIGIVMARTAYGLPDKLIVIRLDDEGNLLWNKRFPEISIQGALNLQMQISEIDENIVISGIAIDKEQGDGFFVLHLSADGILQEGALFKHSTVNNYIYLAQSAQSNRLFLAATEEGEEGACHLLEYDVNTRDIVYSGEVNAPSWYVEDIEIDSDGQKYLLFKARQDTALYQSIVTQLAPNYDFEWDIAFKFGRRLLVSDQHVNILGNVSDKFSGLVKLDKTNGDYQSVHLYNESSIIPTLMPSLALTSGGNAIWHFFTPSIGACVINTAPDGGISSCPPFTGCSIDFVRGGAPELTTINFNRSILQEQDPIGIEMQDFELVATDFCMPFDFTADIELPASACTGDTLTARGTFAEHPILTNWIAPGAAFDSLQTDSIQLVYGQAGTYEVQYEWALFGCRDTASAEVEIGETPVFSLPADSALCPGDSLLLSTALDTDSYELEWQDGSTQAEQWATAPGLYYLTATSLSTRCRSTDSTALTALPLPLLDLGEDIVECAAEWAIGNTVNPNWDYQWNTGATLPETTVAQSGTYRLSVTNSQGCTSSDSLEVSLLPRPQFRYSPDTSFCPGQPILLNAQAASEDSLTFLWPDGSSGNTFQPDQPGTYSLIAANAACKDTVAIVVEAGDCQSEVFVPTAFSPNDDGRNDFFQAFGPGIEPLRLQVFHRWGGLLYEGTGADARWDGRANGKAVNAGHYVYVLEYRDRLSLEVRQRSGTVVVVR